MSKKEIEKIEGMFYSLSVIEFSEKEKKFYFKISRHNIHKIFEEIEKYAEEDIYE